MTRAASLTCSSGALAALAAITLWQPLPARAQAQPADVPAAAPQLVQPPARAPSPALTAPAAARDSLFGLLLQIGPFSGFGGGVQVGTLDFGLRAAAGWTPVLLAVTGTTTDLKFYGGGQISPDLYVRLVSPRETTHIGAQGGYRYNSLLGHGLAVGGYAQFGVSPAIDCLISAGLVIYPDGENHIKKEESALAGAQFAFPGPSVNFGISVGLLFPL